MKSNTNLRRFILLWAGELISSIGGGLTSFGLGVYIFQQTGSAASMSLITLLGFLPTLLLSVPAGVLADRYDRRLLMMIGDGCSALGILFILICMMKGGASLIQICIGVLISAVFSALLEPAFRATITDLLTKEEYSRAGGLVSLAGSARYLLSPVLAGFLLTISDVKLLLVIDICTFFLTVLCAAAVRRCIGKKTSESKENFLSSIREGWRIFRSSWMQEPAVPPHGLCRRPSGCLPASRPGYTPAGLSAGSAGLPGKTGQGAEASSRLPARF